MKKTGEAATLAVCMIVKNEERFLPDCLTSIRDIADQIILLDTGSTDATKAVGKKFKAEIHDFRWVDDFAAARNESIKYAACDWILWLDADERLTIESKSIIKDILVNDNRTVFYNIRIQNLDQEGVPVNLSSAHRLFPNHKGILFEGAIHEQISASARARGLKEVQSNITLNHLGYGLAKPEARTKEQRNRKLLQKMLKRTPQNAYVHFTYAQHLDLANENHQAYTHYKKALTLHQFDSRVTAALLNCLAGVCIKLQRYQEAIESCHQSINRVAIQCGAYYQLYRVANLTNQPDRAISALTNLLQSIEALAAGHDPLPSDIIVNKWTVQFTLGRIYHQLADWQNAEKVLAPLLAEKPDNQELLERLADIALQTFQLPRAEKYFNQLIALKGAQEELLSCLGLIKIKQQDFPAAIRIYQKIIAQNPINQDARKKLVGLYGKIGDLAMAQQLFAQLPT
jgi:tetratricopeptide (TPR) repeat protein